MSDISILNVALNIANFIGLLTLVIFAFRAGRVISTIETNTRRIERLEQVKQCPLHSTLEWRVSETEKRGREHHPAG